MAIVKIVVGILALAYGVAQVCMLINVILHDRGVSLQMNVVICGALAFIALAIAFACFRGVVKPRR